MSTNNGSKVIINGWKSFAIFEAVTDGSSAFPSIDLFQDIATLPSTNDEGKEIVHPIKVNEDAVNICLVIDDGSDWGNGENDEFDRNAFELIADDGSLFGSLYLVS